jgi:hypothetical protein
MYIDKDFQGRLDSYASSSISERGRLEVNNNYEAVIAIFLSLECKVNV